MKQNAKRYDIGRDVNFKDLVLSLIQTHSIMTTEAVVAEDGTHLISKNTKLLPSHIELIRGHRLDKPLDQTLVAIEPYSINEMVGDIEHLLASSLTLKHLYSSLSSQPDLKALFHEQILPANIAFNLLICKEIKPTLYTHSLLIAAISLYMATSEGMSETQLKNVVLSSVQHDLGLLHLNMGLFESKRRLKDREHRYLHVHAVLSRLISQVGKPVNQIIASAIGDHHERLDGTGYPMGKKGNQISLIGQVIAISEVVASKFNQNQECDRPDQLELLLNMNYKKLNSKLYAHLSTLYDHAGEASIESSSNEIHEIKTKLAKLSDIIKSWTEQHNSLDQNEQFPFVDDYIQTLHESLTQAGLNFDQLELLNNMIADDNAIRTMAIAIIDEANWQIDNLLRELKRRELYMKFNHNLRLNGWLRRIESFSE